MKVKAVSALRSKRGLRPVMRVAEPPVVGLTPQTTNEWKANTMKPYILRDPKPVERQKSIRRPRPKPAAPVALKGPVLFIGLDVHNDSIAVSLAPSNSTEVRRYGILGGELEDVLKLAKRLAARTSNCAGCMKAGRKRGDQSGDKSRAVQTLREDRWRRGNATAFGGRVLEHRFSHGEGNIQH
jgi:hypothetical protein